MRLLVPKLPDADALLPLLRGIDARRRYSNGGPLVGELENGLAALTGAPHVACVSSGTAAIELALRALCLPEDAGVALPALTFPATAIAVLRAGLRPVLLDIDPQTLQLSLAATREAAAAGAVAAALPVALFGQGVDARRWGDFAQTTGLPVVVDAAGAIGFQEFDPRLVLAFSLHATKPLSSGEGGFVAAADLPIVDALRVLANFGFADGTVARAGANGKMSEYHAAVAVASLKDWARRKRDYERQFGSFCRCFSRAAVSGCRIVNASGVATQMAIRAARPLAQSDLDRFDAAGIETRRWYWPPLHRHAAFAAFAPKSGLPATDAEAERLLGVPWHADLGEDDLARICATLAEAFA